MKTKLINTPALITADNNIIAFEIGKKILAYKQSIAQMKTLLNSYDISESACLGYCKEYSANWYLMLEPTFPVDRMMVIVPRYHTFAWMHLFLVDNTLEEEIIIDPTYRQLIKGAVDLEYLPDIFVGTRSDLLDIFKKHSDRLRFGVKDLSPGVYDPENFLAMTYGYGHGTRGEANLTALQHSSENMRDLIDALISNEVGQLYSRVP